MNPEIKFLCVEDNDLDVEKIERSFRKLRIANPLIRVHDGEEALAMMREDGLERPYVVLLDLNMPRMNGHEFLAEIRSDPVLRKTPVFVLTSSAERKDVERAYEQNVAGYMTKPITRDSMLEAIETLHSYWRLCTLPEA